jgi:hypothetical protein
MNASRLFFCREQAYPVAEHLHTEEAFRMRKVTAVVIVLMVSSLVLFAQAPPMPKPGPEQARLKYFVGDWKTEGDMKASPMGPGGKFSSTDHNMMLGDFFLVLHSDGTSPMGNAKSVSFISFDPKEKMYVYDGYDSMGMHDISKGNVSGDTWTYTSDMDMGGKTMHGRFTLKEVSPTSFTMKYDMSADGNTWNTFMEATATKVK